MGSPESQSLRKMIKEQEEASASKTLAEKRQGMDEMAQQFFSIGNDVRIETTSISGVPCEWVIPAEHNDNQTIIYFHGGGYSRGSIASHRHLAADLARTSKSKALVVGYRLAPEHPYPAPVEDALSVYKELLATGMKPEHLTFAGDSAGGNLVLVTMLALKDDQLPLPKAAVLMSPWTDLKKSGESYQTRAQADPWLTDESVEGFAHDYAGAHDRGHYLLSPLYGDLTGLPPMLIHVGKDEILLDDSLQFVEKAKQAGVEAEVKVWEDMFHIFTFFGQVMPEGHQSAKELGEFLKKQFAGD
ncbi:alpha/beta hydrolase [Bacillus tianshenii]|nr:alpha/beta hydrolase [Bacillus tianshenii]